VLPAGARREILYNVISDGACATLVERDAPQNRLLAWRQVTKGYYWDCAARKNEIVAAYFPTARNVAREALATGARVHDLVLEKKLMTREQLDQLLQPEILTKPHYTSAHKPGSDTR